MPNDSSRGGSRLYAVRVGLNFVLGGVCTSPLMYALYRFHLLGGRHSDALIAMVTSAVTGAVGGYSLERNPRTAGAFAAAFAILPITVTGLYMMLRSIPNAGEAPGLPLILATVLLLPALSYGIVGTVGALLARSCRPFKTGVITAFALAGAVGGLCSPMVVGWFSPWALRPYGAMVSLYWGEILTLFLAGTGVALVIRRRRHEPAAAAESPA
jgi:hypothetical protein